MYPIHFKGSETQEKVTEFEVRYATVVVPKTPADSDKTGLVYMLPVQGAFFYNVRTVMVHLPCHYEWEGQPAIWAAFMGSKMLSEFKAK
jgi:hypothetical protein